LEDEIFLWHIIFLGSQTIKKLILGSQLLRKLSFLSSLLFFLAVGWQGPFPLHSLVVSAIKATLDSGSD